MALSGRLRGRTTGHAPQHHLAADTLPSIEMVRDNISQSAYKDGMLVQGGDPCEVYARLRVG